MIKLINAKEARLISNSVIAGESKEQIGHEVELLEKLIDKACHRGEHTVKIHEYLSDYTTKELEYLGYTVKRSRENVWYDDESIISW